MSRPTVKSAVAHINRHGALLVFPVKTNLNIPSLWKCFHPRTTMRWEWSDDGDAKVPELWHLREELSRCRKVVYVKWFQGRATFFSGEVFTALLSVFSPLQDPLSGLGESSRTLFRTLEDDSPLPTRELKALAGFEGRAQESAFQRGIRPLWNRLLIVGYGEVEEGGFPSLAIGSSRLLFEDQWEESLRLTSAQRAAILSRAFPSGSPFEKAYLRFLAAAQNIGTENSTRKSTPGISAETVKVQS